MSTLYIKFKLGITHFAYNYMCKMGILIIYSVDKLPPNTWVKPFKVYRNVPIYRYIIIM